MILTLRRACGARLVAMLAMALALLPPSTLAQASGNADLLAVPASQGLIVDITGRLSTSEREALSSAALQLHYETGAQLFTLIVDHTDPETIKDYA